ncbi:MAG: hypothetical protein JST31_04340 [Actinobacteria bacterium]|nr:hypothetical protein [Actinomycetota bacterium]
MAIALAVAAAGVSAVVAYAATRSGGLAQELAGRLTPPRERLLRPQLIETPAARTVASDPQFRFHVPPRKPRPKPPTPQPGAPPRETSSRRFQCRLDGGGWKGCRSPYRLSGLTPGSHRFAVRVFNREGRVGEPTNFEWRQSAPEPASAPAPPPVAPPVPTAPEQFSIVALQNPEDLYPGLAPTPIPLRVTNANDVAIEVTAITAAIGAAPASCGAANFELTPAGVSPQDPLTVPADSSVEIPPAEAPTIRMLDLPVEQDACRGAEVPLVFSGEAHG